MSFLLQKFKKEENKQMPKIVFNENFGVDEITIVLERRVSQNTENSKMLQILSIKIL